jgi:hypothetical protein
MSPTRSEYKVLGIELVSLGEKSSCTPKITSMVGEKKDGVTRDSFKLFLEESLL